MKIFFIHLPKQHNDYELHSYVIPIILKEKFDKNKFVENDFYGKDKKLNKNIFGFYFKFMLLKNYNLKPFPNINLNTKELDNYIFSKYREANIINKEKCENTDKIFHLKDDNSKELSKLYNMKLNMRMVKKRN